MLSTALMHALFAHILTPDVSVNMPPQLVIRCRVTAAVRGDQVTPEMRIAWEEPFGPVIPVVRVATVEAAIDHCNTNNLALQARLSSAPLTFTAFGCMLTRAV